jgi:hypothetical protein
VVEALARTLGHTQPAEDPGFVADLTDRPAKPARARPATAS